VTTNPTNIDVPSLEALATDLRIEILEMIAHAGSGHPGGSLSVIDLLVALYSSVLRHDSARADWPDRDRVVLSKGHGVPALYAVLAHFGYFDKGLLNTLRQLGSPLQGHPVRGTLPGIEACTGSLGQGLSVAQGVALSARIDGKDFNVYCIMGDGEIQEGQIWEAAMSAAKYRVDNLVGIIDYNKGQIDGPVSEVMPIDPLAAKWTAFNWLTREIDGHDYTQILDGLAWAKTREGQPKLLIAHTIKGKGVEFMETELTKWHGVAPTAEELAHARDLLRNETRRAP
jgi:transketolase